MGQRQSSTNNNDNSNNLRENRSIRNNNEDDSTRRGRVIRPNSRLNTERNNPLSRSNIAAAYIPVNENQRRDERRSRRARIREEQLNGEADSMNEDQDANTTGDDRNIVNLMSTVSQALDAMTQNTLSPTLQTAPSSNNENSNNGMSPFSRMIAQVISEAVVTSFRNGHFPSSSNGIPSNNQQQLEQEQEQQQNVRQQLTMHLSPELFQQLEPESTEDMFMRFMRLPIILTSVSSANETRVEGQEDTPNAIDNNNTTTTATATATATTTTTTTPTAATSTASPSTAVNADGEAPTLSEGESEVTRILMLPVFLYGLRATQPTDTTSSNTNTSNGTRSSARIRERLEREREREQQQSSSGGGQWTVYIISGNNVDAVMNESPSYEELLDLASIIGPARRPTVSQEAIDMHVPIVKFTQQVKQSILGDSDGCQVCLTTYQSEDDVRILQCHHGFHKICIDKWLTEGQNKCPLCRDVPVPITSTTSTQ